MPASRSRFFRPGELPLVILAALERGNRTAYELMVELDGLFGDAYDASSGSVYPAVRALADERMIDGMPNGRATKYAITGRGRQMLTANADVIARIETRTRRRVRPDGSIDALLARFNAEVRALSPAGRDLERALDRALANIRRTTEATT